LPRIPPWARNPVGICLFALTFSSNVGQGSDVVPSPCNQGVTDTGLSGDACNDDDYNDPCEQERKKLQGWRDMFIQQIATIKDPAIRAKVTRDFAKWFNPDVKRHNSVCPKHKVDPIGPTAVK
jgi:hypothetical protein